MSYRSTLTEIEQALDRLERRLDALETAFNRRLLKLSRRWLALRLMGQFSADSTGGFVSNRGRLGSE